MTQVIVGMTMSLDGFISDRNGSAAALYPDLEALRETEPLQKSIQNTGAVVMGRNAFAMAEDPDSIADHYEYQVPIFVLTHDPPKKHPKENANLTFTFVTDGIESAIGLAKAAAGDKDVTVVGGASTLQQCLTKGLADELHIDVMPLFLSVGLRPFGANGTEQIQLERMKVMELPAGRTHLEFRIVR